MTNKRMHSYRLTKPGSANVARLTEEAIPTPGHGQVLVHVRASAINFRDLIIANGWYPLPIPDDQVPLSDGAGEVVAVGEGVSRFKKGDRVANSFFPNLYAGKFNQATQQWVAHHEGWLTEYKVVSAEALVGIPDHLSFEEAATLPCAAVTAWSALQGVRAGDTVLTQGTGGVALFALQFAKAMGARVIATTSSWSKAARLAELGADHVLNYKTVEEWGLQARSLTAGLGVDRVIEVGGPQTLTQSLKAVALGGQISIVGVLAGVEGSIDFMSVFQSQAVLKTVVLGNRGEFEDLMRAIAQHNIRPVIDSVYGFESLQAAWDHFSARDVFGKVVIRH